MELPAALRQGVEQALAGIAPADLARAAARLSQRYRAEVRDGRFHIGDDRAALAYLATRLPATYAAVRAAMEQVAVARPDFAPAALLDVGAGPGTALWAAADCWPDLDQALLVEASASVRGWGERLTQAGPIARVDWRAMDFSQGLPETPPRDLVTAAYVLDEIDAETRRALTARLWALTRGVLLIVEPGTPAGFARILAVRAQLIAASAHLLAPCPHAQACPIVAPDWCHFARRVARSRAHRLAKGAEVPWEDEKFAYVAAARIPALDEPARVVGPPRQAGGRAWLKLCRPDGTLAERMFTRRDGDAYKAARRARWGDAVPTDAEEK
ncbi:MAG: small ribosomal subunit Rsm22 family protein [Variibacter sp.]